MEFRDPWRSFEDVKALCDLVAMYPFRVGKTLTISHNHVWQELDQRQAEGGAATTYHVCRVSSCHSQGEA